MAATKWQGPLTETTTTANLVPAVERAIRILLAFESGDAEYGVSELSRMLDLNKSTAYDILNTLAHFGFLERNEATKKYRLGPTLLQLGHLVQARATLREISRPRLRALADEFGQTAILGQFTVENDILTVDAVVPEGTLSISTTVGRRLPHSAGAFGKIFHAALPLEELDALLARQGLRRFTEHTIVDVAAYKRELVKVRTLGYALDREEYLEGVCAVAAPIVDRDGHVVASLCVVGFSSQLNDELLRRLTQAVPAACQQISVSLGATRYPAWNGTVRVTV